MIKVSVGFFSQKKTIWRRVFAGIFHTIGGTLWHWLLATTTANANTVDDIALLGLVTETTGLVWSGWARCAVDDIQLSELY